MLNIDIVDKGLINSAIFQSFLIFFGLFSVGPPGRSLIMLFFGLFSLSPPSSENFSADALG